MRTCQTPLLDVEHLQYVNQAHAATPTIVAGEYLAITMHKVFAIPIRSSEKGRQPDSQWTLLDIPISLYVSAGGLSRTVMAGETSWRIWIVSPGSPQLLASADNNQNYLLHWSFYMIELSI